jgi:hypothetical protein
MQITAINTGIITCVFALVQSLIVLEVLQAVAFGDSCRLGILYAYITCLELRTRETAVNDAYLTVLPANAAIRAVATDYTYVLDNVNKLVKLAVCEAGVGWTVLAPDDTGAKAAVLSKHGFFKRCLGVKCYKIDETCVEIRPILAADEVNIVIIINQWRRYNIHRSRYNAVNSRHHMVVVEVCVL